MEYIGYCIGISRVEVDFTTMVFGDIHSEEAQVVEEPPQITAAELHGCGPPCIECGCKERTGPGYCTDCRPKMTDNEVLND